MSLKLNTASGGSITLQEADTASNLTLTVPAQAGSIVTADSSGNVGIGTSSPSAQLQLNKSGTGDYTSLRLSNSGASGKTYEIGLGGNTASTGYANNLYFYDSSASALRMILNSAGRVLINKTTSTGQALQVVGYANNGAVGVQVSGNGEGGVDFYNASGTYISSIVVNSGSVAYNTTSDYRLKENIAPMTGALSKVQQLKPVTWSWKNTGEQAEGFIAHELAEVCPDAVSGQKDAVDDDGNPKYQGIDTSFLVATLTAAIQELKAVVDAQANTITAMEARLTVLEQA